MIFSRQIKSGVQKNIYSVWSLVMHKRLTGGTKRPIHCRFDIGESRHPWVGVCLGPIVFFQKVWKQKSWIFLHEVEKMISVIFVQDQSKKLNFSSLKKYTLFSRDKSKFFVQSFSLLKLAKLNFSSLKKKTSFSRDKSKFFIKSFSLLKLAKLKFSS